VSGERDAPASPASTPGGPGLKGSVLGDIGLALLAARRQADMSAAQLARRAGMGKSQLSKYESGKELPKLDSLERLLVVLGMDGLTFFYTSHQLGRFERADARVALLEGANLGPWRSEAEVAELRLVLNLLVDRLDRGVLGQVRRALPA
jgi:transcriptional regulator with XRE-family HTH domain